MMRDILALLLVWTTPDGQLQRQRIGVHRAQFSATGTGHPDRCSRRLSEMWA